MTNERTIISRNKREGAYAGKMWAFFCGRVTRKVHRRSGSHDYRASLEAIASSLRPF